MTRDMPRRSDRSQEPTPVPARAHAAEQAYARMRVGARVRDIAGLAILAALAAIFAGCGARTTADANVDAPSSPADEAPAMDVTPEDRASGSASTADALAAERGRLRAQAWPPGADDAAWQVLERGEGVYLSEEDAGRPWVFVFSAAESSVPVRGLIVDLPAEAPADALPTHIRVRTSPTPVEVTREAWPVITRQLAELGYATIPAERNTRIYVEFEYIERVSLLEVEVISSVGGRQVAFGRLSLVHQHARLADPRVRRVKLRAQRDDDASPDESGILGVEDATPLGQNPNEREVDVTAPER